MPTTKKTLAACGKTHLSANNSTNTPIMNDPKILIISVPQGKTAPAPAGRTVGQVDIRPDRKLHHEKLPQRMLSAGDAGHHERRNGGCGCGTSRSCQFSPDPIDS